ncbi:TetR/AcrR family transcriptional regulator [Actinomadura sp. SCN-SB]|uniref:TetR/AcrR family transcriptional regulator n=1 Tax=Actinomadura sp. SCN-SB TaxID=3373092 RepID=UPI0037504A15
MGTSESGGTGLPEGIELAWGLRERPGKGPKRALTLRAVVEAAVRVGSAEGLEAVSMSRVASELGVSPMALYRYVPSKNDLLTLMMDEVFGPPPPLPDAGEHGWRAALGAWMSAMRAALAQHPWILRVPITGPPTMPNNVRWMEAGLRAMRGMGLSGGERLSALMLLSTYVRSDVTLQHDLQAAWRAASASEAEVLRGYGALLATLTDAERFPELHALLDEGVFEWAVDDPDADFAFGRERLLDGLELLVARRSG